MKTLTYDAICAMTPEQAKEALLEQARGDERVQMRQLAIGIVRRRGHIPIPLSAAETFRLAACLLREMQLDPCAYMHEEDPHDA